MKKKLKQLEKLLLEIQEELERENILCSKIDVSLWKGQDIRMMIWNGYRYLVSLDRCIELSISDILELLKNPKRRILFKKF